MKIAIKNSLRIGDYVPYLIVSYGTVGCELPAASENLSLAGETDETLKKGVYRAF